MKAVDAVTTLEELGAAQWGLVTTAQAGEYDVSRVALGRLRDEGIIHPVRRGVWALPSADHGPLQELRAAWLAIESASLATTRRGGTVDLAVSHTSAAVVHFLGDLIPARHEFTTERRRQTTQPDMAFHRGELGEDITIVHGLPVTSIPRTVEDLAASGVDFEHLAEIIRDALGSPEVRWRDLGRRLDPLVRRFGYDTGPDLINGSLEHAGLPPAVANLVESPAFSTVLNRQWATALNQEILGAVLPTIRTPEFMADLSREMGRVIAEQMDFQWLVPRPGLQSQHSEGSDLRNASAARAGTRGRHDGEKDGP